MAEPKIYVIGSAPDCDIPVDAPHVSGHHCQLTYDRGGFLLEDLGSTNGTYVNGVRITEETIVTRGERVTLGRSTLMPWPDDSTPSRSGKYGTTAAPVAAAPTPTAPPVPPAIPTPPPRTPERETPPPESFDPGPPKSDPAVTARKRPARKTEPATPAVREPAESARPGARFADPDALDPPDRGGGGNRLVVIAGSLAGLFAAFLVGWAIFGGDGGETDPTTKKDGEKKTGPENPDDGNIVQKDDTKKDDPKPPEPPPLPPVKTDPKDAVVWIGFELAGREYRNGTAFALSDNTLVTAGWHGDVWLEEAFENDEVTVLAGIGSTVARVTGWERVAVDQNEYGLARLSIEPLTGLVPVDPATIGPPPQLDQPIRVFTWDGWENKGDTHAYAENATFGEATVKKVAWKVAFLSDEFDLISKNAGAPVTIGDRVIGILVIGGDGEPRVLTLAPVLE